MTLKTEKLHGNDLYGAGPAYFYILCGKKILLFYYYYSIISSEENEDSLNLQW